MLGAFFLGLIGLSSKCRSLCLAYGVGLCPDFTQKHVVTLRSFFLGVHLHGNCFPRPFHCPLGWQCGCEMDKLPGTFQDQVNTMGCPIHIQVASLKDNENSQWKIWHADLQETQTLSKITCKAPNTQMQFFTRSKEDAQPQPACQVNRRPIRKKPLNRHDYA